MYLNKVGVGGKVYALFFQFEALSYPLILNEVKTAKNLTYKPAANYISDVSTGRYFITFVLIVSTFPEHICYQQSK